MKKSWNICTMEIQRLLKKPQSYLLMFVMPLLFTFIFGSLTGTNQEKKMTVLLVDHDQTPLSHSFISHLNKKNTLFEVNESTLIKANQLLQSRDMPAAIIINKGFQDGVLKNDLSYVKLEKIPEFTSSPTITQFINNQLANISLEVTASKNWSSYTGEAWEVMYHKLENTDNPSSLKIQKVNIDKKNDNLKMNDMSARASGFSIMFVMITMMSVTGTILEARKNGVWYRILTTPATKFEISFGYLLSFFIIGWIQFGLLIIATHFIFHVEWGNLPALILLVSAMLLAIVGLGLLIAGLVKTSEQQASIGNLIIVSTCMISGVYWPLEIEPTFMQKIAEFLPQTWAIKGFTELMTNGGTIINLVDSIGVLLIFGIVFLLVGVRKIKYE